MRNFGLKCDKIFGKIHSPHFSHLAVQLLERSMPRARRYIEANTIYHVVCRGNNGQILFHVHQDFKTYLSLIAKFQKKHPATVFHYCLMPNHVHILLQAGKEEDLSKLMQKTNLCYFFHYKKSYGYNGHLFQDRFRSVPVTREAHLLACGRYIEMNPVRAGLVEEPVEYRYSSFRFYALGITDSLLTPNPFFLQLGGEQSERQERFHQFVLSESQTQQICRFLHRGSFLRTVPGTVDKENRPLFCG